tara:strand:- start:243 stop:596 length:354 start_codon:yes stop_codon:yes gene_type:complete
MAIIKDNRMPCSITDGPQEDGWVDDVEDMEPLAFLELAIERLPESEIFDWFVDEFIGLMQDNDFEVFKRVIYAGIYCVASSPVYHRLGVDVLEKVCERAAKEMKENEDVARRVFSRD